MSLDVNKEWSVINCRNRQLANYYSKIDSASVQWYGYRERC